MIHRRDITRQDLSSWSNHDLAAMERDIQEERRRRESPMRKGLLSTPR